MSNSPLYSPNTAMGTVDVATQMALHKASLHHAAMMNTPQTVIGSASSANVYDNRDPFTRRYTAKQMVCMRLHVADFDQIPFDFLECHIGESEVIVFLVVNGDPVFIRDDRTMFPSDALVTKLNLLRR